MFAHGCRVNGARPITPSIVSHGGFHGRSRQMQRASESMMPAALWGPQGGIHYTPLPSPREPHRDPVVLQQYEGTGRARKKEKRITKRRRRKMEGKGRWVKDSDLNVTSASFFLSSINTAAEKHVWFPVNSELEIIFKLYAYIFLFFLWLIIYIRILPVKKRQRERERELKERESCRQTRMLRLQAARGACQHATLAQLVCPNFTRCQTSHTGSSL